MRASGLGYMVFDIATEMALRDDLHIEVVNFRENYESVSVNGCRFIGMSRIKALQYFKLENTLLVLKMMAKYWRSQSFMKNLIYGYAVSGYIFNIIKKGGYDIIHFHGCSPMTELTRQYCRRHRIPFAITLHGLNSFGGVNMELYNKLFEKDMLSKWYKERQSVSFVSTGSKLQVLKYLNASRSASFYTIPNFTNLSIKEIKDGINIRKQYNIPDDGFVILYIGNIGYRKNQLTFVKSINALTEDQVKNIYVLFLGRDGSGDESIKNVIESSKNASHMRLCGIVPKDLIATYLSQGNATALISYSEGFGLGIIEGMRFGLPSIAIDDMDGIPDFYSEDTMVLLEDREVETVCAGLEKLLSKRWIRENIIKHSMQFTGTKISGLYKDFYEKTISQNG